MKGYLRNLICACGALLITGNARPDLVYPTPEAPQPVAGDEKKTCAQLDREITALMPLSYSNRPGFYQDPINGAAVWVGSMKWGPAYGLLGYTTLMDHRDRMRIYSVQQRIELLRRFKARQHCFEDDYFRH